MNFIELIHNFAVTLIILLAALGLGDLVINSVLVFQPNGQFRFWISQVIGLGGLSVITMVLGMVGLFITPVFVILTLALAIWGVIRTYLTVKTITKPKLSLNKWSYLLIGIIIFIITSSLIWSLLVHALMPPHEWDEIAYHLALAKSYIQAGRIYYMPSILTSNYPLNFSMLYSIALFWKADIAPHLINLAMTILIISGLVNLGKHFTDIHVGWIAATLFLTIPLTKRLVGTGLIDVAMGAYGLASLIVLEQWRIKKQRGWLVICGLVCGFIAGSKLTGAIFIILVGLLILWEHLATKKVQKRLVVKDFLAFGLAASIVVIPWYARSFIFTGNPVFPFVYSIFGGRNWDAIGDENLYRHAFTTFTPNIKRNFVGLVQTLRIMINNPNLLGGYHGGLGIIVPLGFLASLLSLRWAPRWVVANAFVCVFFFLSWFMFASLQLRYLLPIAPLMAWNFSYFTVWLVKQHHLRLVQIILSLILVYFVCVGWPWAKVEDRQIFLSRVPYLNGQMTREQWLETKIDVFPVFSYVNHHLPEESRLLLLPYENRGYYLNRSYFWGHPISQRVIKYETYQNPRSLARILSDMGFTHIIDNPNLVFTDISYWKHDRALMIALEEQCSEPIYQYNNITLYKLHQCND